jgi:RNA polymerase sigma factor (TIGR02999 family)
MTSSAGQPPGINSAVDTSHAVTQLLHQLSAGQEDAAERLIPLIYAELHEIAERQMRRERTDHTLQPTALVHEAFLRLVGNQHASWQNRQQFLGVAAQAMRRILVDHARRQKAQKRGSGGEKIELDEALIASGGDSPSIDLEALDGALTRLAELDPRHARMVELRFFGGLSVEETAEILGISPATVKRDWQFAKAWLKKEIGG